MAKIRDLYLAGTGKDRDAWIALRKGAPIYVVELPAHLVPPSEGPAGSVTLLICPETGVVGVEFVPNDGVTYDPPPVAMDDPALARDPVTGDPTLYDQSLYVEPLVRVPEPQVYSGEDTLIGGAGRQAP